MVNRLVITTNNFGHVVRFVCAKQLLEPMRLLVSCPQSNFIFKKIDEIIHIYKETREKADGLFQSVYTKAVSLATEFGIEEKWPA